MSWEEICESLSPYQAGLVAVSKTKPPAQILELYHKGQKVFGENKVQEIVDKFEVLPKDIEWHFIGHLQTNKVKYIAPFVKLIHAVDSLRLLQEIDKQAAKYQRTIPCLLQFKIAAEDSKFGLSPDAAQELLSTTEFAALQHVRVDGVMGMATFTEDVEQVRREFRRLRQIFEQLKAGFFPDKPHFKEVSMGMSDDYQIALEEGSTLVRIGSLLFGAR